MKCKNVTGVWHHLNLNNSGNYFQFLIEILDYESFKEALSKKKHNNISVYKLSIKRWWDLFWSCNTIFLNANVHFHWPCRQYSSGGLFFQFQQGIKIKESEQFCENRAQFPIDARCPTLNSAMSFATFLNIPCS